MLEKILKSLISDNKQTNKSKSSKIISNSLILYEAFYSNSENLSNPDKITIPKVFHRSKK